MSEIEKLSAEALRLVNEHFDRAEAEGGDTTLYAIEVTGEKQGLDMKRLFSLVMAEQKKDRC
jgi:hypothetical protein